MAFKSVVPLACVGVPDLGSPVERASDYLVPDKLEKISLPIGVIESHRVYYIFVLLEGEQFSAANSVPHFASPIVAVGDEPKGMRS